MQYQIDVLKGITEANREEWNALIQTTGGTAFHTYEWLKSYEDAPPSVVYHARHITLRQGSQLLAVAPCYHIASDPHFNSYRTDYAFSHPILEAPMVVSHSWYAFYNRICSAAPLSHVVPYIASTMREIAEDLSAPYFGFPGVAAQEPLSSMLQALGFLGSHTEATCTLINQAPLTTTAYLQSLKRNTRHDLRRRAKTAFGHGVRLSFDKDPAAVALFTDLLKSLCDKHGDPMSNPPENLRSVFANLDPYLHFLTLWYGDTMLGGLILLEFNQVLYGWIAGLNYDYTQRFSTYYVLLHCLMEFAEERQIQRIEIGRGGYAKKIRLGYHPVLLQSWFKATTPAAEASLREAWSLIDHCLRTPTRIHEAYAEAGMPPPSRDPWEALPAQGATYGR